MTNSSQQQLFLDLFQKALSRLDEDDTSNALGALLDVRENGFVNKELDTHIEQLRGAPSQTARSGAMDWIDEVIQRLRTYEGDVFHLVEELSEVSLAVCDNEWIPLEHDAVFDDSMLPMEFESFADFNDFDETKFGPGPDAAAEDSVENDESDGAFSGPEDFDFGALDSPIDRLEMIEDLDEIDELGSFDALDDFDDFDDLEHLGELSSNLSEMTAGLPEESARDDEQQIDFALVEKTKNIDVPPLDDDAPADKGVASSDAFDALFDDDWSEAQEPPAVETTEGAQAGAAANPTPETPALRETARQTPVDQQAARQRMLESDDISDDEMDFDFDLGFEGPSVDEVQPPKGRDWSDEDEDDDLDFDLGFENPAIKSIGPEDSGVDAAVDLAPDESAPAKESLEAPKSDAQDESAGWGTGFDFGFDDDDAFGDSDAAGSGQTQPDRDRRKAPEKPDEPRELDLTPAGMPAVSRSDLGDQKTSARLDAGESTHASDEEQRHREESEASLDDDEFFGLAESLAGDSSSSSFKPVSNSSRTRYRGEPLMGAARGHTPLPLAPTSTHELSEVSDTRQRTDTPNPFAHQAPTGVQKALLDSQSSFVLEEIRASEADEDHSAVRALMKEARRLYETGKFESAHDLLLALMVRDDVEQEAHELLAAVDGELERVYQAQLGSLSKAPTLSVAMSELASMNLDHRFGYLLSQIDGMSSFEDILELSSMSRLETLDVLAQMLTRKIISVS